MRNERNNPSSDTNTSKAVLTRLWAKIERGLNEKQVALEMERNKRKKAVDLFNNQTINKQ